MKSCKNAMSLGVLMHCCIHGRASVLLAGAGKVIVPDSHLITTLTARWINYAASRVDIVITGHQGACKSSFLFRKCLLPIRPNILMTGDKSNRPPSGQQLSSYM